MKVLKMGSRQLSAAADQGALMELQCIALMGRCPSVLTDLQCTKAVGGSY